MAPVFDVVVLGAGPAGSISSLLLSRAGLATLLVDDCKDISFKVGESLPGLAQRILASLQLQDVLSKVPSVPQSGNRTAWGSDKLILRQSLFDPYGAGVHLDRVAFDRALFDTARRCGVKILAGRFKESKQVANKWRLKVISQAQDQMIDCNWVVDCTGRQSAFARSLGRKRRIFDRLVAVVGVIERGILDRDCSITLEASSDGWWYSAPVPHNHRVVIYFTDGDLVHQSGILQPKGFTRLATGTNHIGPFLPEGASILHPPEVVPASVSRLSEPAGDRWVAAGDAAATLDPLSSMGILDAIQGAISAVNVVVGGGTCDYIESTATAHLRHLQAKRSYYQIENRWQHSSFWRRRQVDL